jgi:hypothetical protein
MGTGEGGKGIKRRYLDVTKSLSVNYGTKTKSVNGATGQRILYIGPDGKQA